MRREAILVLCLPATPSLPDSLPGRSGVVHNASPVPTAIRGPLYREVTALASAAAALHESHQVSASITPGGETVAYSLEGTAGMLAELNEARVLLETKASLPGKPIESGNLPPPLRVAAP